MKALLVIALILLALPWSVLLLNRGEAAEVCIWFYEMIARKQAPVVETPFTDIADSPFRLEIQKMYALHMTMGTTLTTYSPDARLELYQALIFAGKTLLRIKEAVHG